MSILALFKVEIYPLLAVTVTVLLINTLWYAPFAFGGVWKRMQRDLTPNRPCAQTGVLINFLTCILVLWLLSALQQGLNIRSFPDGVVLGFTCSLGFMGTFTLCNSFFFQIPLKCWALDFGFQLVIFTFASGALKLF